MITVSCVRNQDILHEIVLVLDAMSVTDMVTLSWTFHTEYLLQELQQLTTFFTEMEKIVLLMRKI